MDLRETDILGADIDQHWYYLSKARAMSRVIRYLAPKAVLDVGAGSGFFSRYLLANSEVKEAWCIDTSYPSDSSESASGKTIHFQRSIETCGADLILMMDVLEHVEDDIAMLKQYAQKVPCGSSFLITVPAFQFLWSEHDEFLAHKRRYTLKQLEETVGQAGLTVKQGAYYFGMTFPIAASLRLAQRISKRGRSTQSQLKKHTRLVNFVLQLLCNMEIPLMRLNRLAGLTVFCLAQKTES